MNIQNTILKTSGLLFWIWKEDDKTLLIQQYSSQTDNLDELIQNLEKHPFLERITDEHREPFISLFTDLTTKNISDIHYEFQIKHKGGQRWMLLVGSALSGSREWAGMIIPNESKAREREEKAAIQKHIKWLLIRDEENKRITDRLKYEKEIARKDAELVAELLVSAEKSQQLKEIIIKLEAPRFNKASLIRSIRSDLAPQINWEELMSYFSNIHPDFTARLLSAAPALTERELKICVLVRLGLRSKDIARVSSLSNKSVEIYRYRIRQKLTLSRSQNLFTQLLDY